MAVGGASVIVGVIPPAWFRINSLTFRRRRRSRIPSQRRQSPIQLRSRCTKIIIIIQRQIALSIKGRSLILFIKIVHSGDVSHG